MMMQVKGESVQSNTKIALICFQANRGTHGAPDEHGKECDPAVALEARRRIRLARHTGILIAKVTCQCIGVAAHTAERRSRNLVMHLGAQ